MRQGELIWWHFSDIHWEVNSSTDRRNFLRTLFEHLSQRIDEFGPPRFLIISGDISYSAEKTQYTSFETEFLGKIRSLSGVGEPLIFVVAGNHDVQRSVYKTLAREPVLAISSGKDLNSFLDTAEFLEMIKRPFQNFDEFSERIMPTLSYDSLCWHYLMDQERQES